MFKSMINPDLSGKKILLIMLLLIALAVTLLSEEEIVTSFYNIHLKKVMYNWELIENYDFGERFGSVYLTEPNLHDSGTLSLVRPNSDPKTLISFDTDLSPTKLGNDFNHLSISKHGKYFITLEGVEEINDSKLYIYSLFDKMGNKIWNKKVPKGVGFGETNESGVCLSGDEYDWISIVPKIGDQITVGPFYNEKSKPFLSLGDYGCRGLLSNSGELVVLATENRDIPSENYYSFPTGSRILFYSENGELLKTYNLEGTEIWWPYKFSKSGKYFIMRNDPYMYLFKDTELLLKKDVRELLIIEFSEDESVVFIGTGKGSFIMGPETGDIIKNTTFGGSEISIANRDCPIVSCIMENEVYVANYETGEVMLSDVIQPRGGNRPKIQISGDGKTISVAYNRFFRKYRIGGRK